MITKIIKGTFRDKSSVFNGSPCVCVIMEKIESNEFMVSYLFEGANCGEYPITFSDKSNPNEMLKINDDFRVIFNFQEDHKVLKLEEGEMLRMPTVTLQSFFGENIKSLNVEYK